MIALKANGASVAYRLLCCILELILNEISLCELDWSLVRHKWQLGTYLSIVLEVQYHLYLRNFAHD